MSTKVFIGNLPAGTTGEEVRELLNERGWPLLGLEQVAEGNPDRITFAVEVDIDSKTAKLMADRARDHFFKGRKISLNVPLS